MYFASLDFKALQNTTYPYSSGEKGLLHKLSKQNCIQKKEALNKETKLRWQFRELEYAIICLLQRDLMVASVFENAVCICPTPR